MPVHRKTVLPATQEIGYRWACILIQWDHENFILLKLCKFKVRCVRFLGPRREGDFPDTLHGQGLTYDITETAYDGVLWWIVNCWHGVSAADKYTLHFWVSGTSCPVPVTHQYLLSVTTKQFHPSLVPRAYHTTHCLFQYVMSMITQSMGDTA